VEDKRKHKENQQGEDKRKRKEDPKVEDKQAIELQEDEEDEASLEEENLGPAIVVGESPYISSGAVSIIHVLWHDNVQIHSYMLTIAVGSY
jgi:hypothetical protein